MELLFARNILLALFAGGIIGIERQWRKKLAGLRTTALVCLGSCAFVMLSSFYTSDSSPTRIAAQIVSGIGFLAGGVILRDGFNVKGINTAATLWCAAAVGCLIGINHPIEALFCALAITFTNIILRNISYKIDSMSQTEINQKTQTICYLSAFVKGKNESSARERILNIYDVLDIKVYKVTIESVDDEVKKIMILFEKSDKMQKMLKESIKILMQDQTIFSVDLEEF